MDLTFITAPVAKFLNERVFGHIPSSIAGWLVPALVEVATYWDSIAGVAIIPEKYRPAVHVVAGIIFVAGNAYKKAAPAGAGATPPSAGGFLMVRLGILLSILAIVIIFALPARAQTSTATTVAATGESPATPVAQPKFGGCLTGAEVCFGPSVSISLVAVDLKSGAVTTGANPGLGYGVTWFSKKNPWLSVGFSGYATFRDTAEGQRVVASGVFSFVEYLRVGVGQQIGPGSRPFMLIGIGADLGAGRP